MSVENDICIRDVSSIASCGCSDRPQGPTALVFPAAARQGWPGRFARFSEATPAGWFWSRVARQLVRVSFGERLAGETCGDDAGEVGTFHDVLMWAAQRVLDGLAGGLGFDDLLVELGELALREPPPVVERDSARGHERLLLGEREPDVAQEQDNADEPDCRFGVAPLSRHPGGRREQAEFLVVAQGRGGNAGAARQLADGQQS